MHYSVHNWHFNWFVSRRLVIVSDNAVEHFQVDKGTHEQSSQDIEGNEDKIELEDIDEHIESSVESCALEVVETRHD